MLTIEAIKNIVRPICAKYGVERLFLFGSYARNEATEKSDVDLRVDRGKLRGFAFGGFYGDIEDALASSVDLLTTEQLQPHFLDRIKREEILLYGKP